MLGLKNSFLSSAWHKKLIFIQCLALKSNFYLVCAIIKFKLIVNKVVFTEIDDCFRILKDDKLMLTQITQILFSEIPFHTICKIFKKASFLILDYHIITLRHFHPEHKILTSIYRNLAYS